MTDKVNKTTDRVSKTADRVRKTADRVNTEELKENLNREAAQTEEMLAALKNQIAELQQRQDRLEVARAEDASRITKGRAPLVLQDLRERRNQWKKAPKEMSAKLRELLQGEIEAARKKEKRRSAEILGVFAKHNFYANGFTPAEMRSTLEDLGPTYVKIGQIMSSRTDLLPVSYCRELETLRQNVKELDPAIARAVIEQETGKTIDEIYQEFRDKPLGSASIGQAHYGVLKDGTRVVTKVQRPLIAEMMRKDFVLLKKVARAIKVINENNDEEETVDLLSVIEELEKVTEEELDFRVEAENTRFFKENCIEDEAKVTCPDVIDELTTERIFTMTFVDGYSVSKRDRLIADGYDPDQIGTVILENYVHQVLDVGTFHGDPHQGNIMIAHGVPTWIDFGMIGRISAGDIKLLQDLVLSLLESDLEALVNAVLSMGAGSEKTDRNRLLEDVEEFMSRYVSVTSTDDLDMAVILEQITDLAAKNDISLPGRLTMLVRSIATIEGVIEQLCPTLNLFKLLSDKLMARAKKDFDLKQSMLSGGKEVLAASKKTAKIPTLASDVLSGIVKGRTKLNINLDGFRDMADRAHETARNVVLALFACFMFFGSCILCTVNIGPKSASGFPLVAVGGLVFSVSLGIYTVLRMSRKK